MLQAFLTPGVCGVVKNYIDHWRAGREREKNRTCLGSPSLSGCCYFNSVGWVATIERQAAEPGTPLGTLFVPALHLWGQEWPSHGKSQEILSSHPSTSLHIADIYHWVWPCPCPAPYGLAVQGSACYGRLLREESHTDTHQSWNWGWCPSHPTTELW